MFLPIPKDLSLVKETLLKICKAASRLAIEQTREGALRREDRHYLRRSFAYQEGNLSGAQEEITRSIWDPIAVDAIADGVKAQYPKEIQEIVTELSRAGARDSATLQGELDIFLRVIAESAEEHESAEDVEQVVDRFLHEVKGGAVCWQGRIWLDGVRVESDSVQLGDGLVLRSPISADFDQERPANLGFGLEMPPMPRSVIECERLSRDKPDVRREVNALSLFRLGAVEIVRERWACDSFFPGKGGVEFPYRFLMKSPYEYVVTPREQEKLQGFIAAVAHQLPTKPRGQHKEPRWTPLKYYFKILQATTEPLERLTEAVCCLEASLVKKDEGEISYRLSLRTASLLEFAGFDSLSVFKDMRSAYSLRSDYVHGNTSKPGKIAGVEQLCFSVANYARLAVLKLLQFNVEERSGILNDLEESLLSRDLRRQLESKLCGGLWDLAIQGS